MSIQTLWLSVIEQAIEDFKEHKLCLCYFTSKCFKRVCFLASVEPHDVLEFHGINDFKLSNQHKALLYRCKCAECAK